MKRNKIGLQLTYLFLEKLYINKSYFFIKEAVDISKIAVASNDCLIGY